MFFFFFKQKTAYEIMPSLVGSEMCIRDRGIQGNASYIDDFESTKTGIDLRQPSYWMLASTPYESGSSARFPEASKSNDITYGMNRALLSWYTIDGLFYPKKLVINAVSYKEGSQSAFQSLCSGSL
eukprot:TRINITY_DN17306_c0_g1_i2.p2 TRINITY_DN17306_c0_g1~~TRINITY_DN17306_c0_g1_i2.p2  ORF type:complete len:126 (-),score=9.48 TRINITY_DN17306_c0_g1_i2:117-494(-)